MRTLRFLRDLICMPVAAIAICLFLVIAAFMADVDSPYED